MLSNAHMTGRNPYIPSPQPKAIMVTSAQGEEQNGQRHVQNEVRGMISMLTNRLTGLGKSRGRLDANKDTGDDGVSIITLAGDNEGATMKGNIEELMDTQGKLHNDENGIIAYTNSNYQAVNNSIIFNGNCTVEDPGVHIEISDYLDDDDDDDHDHDKHEKKKKKDKKDKKKKDKKDKKKKKKNKENSEDDGSNESE